MIGPCPKNLSYARFYFPILSFLMRPLTIAERSPAKRYHSLSLSCLLRDSFLKLWARSYRVFKSLLSHTYVCILDPLLKTASHADAVSSLFFLLPARSIFFLLGLIFSTRMLVVWLRSGSDGYPSFYLNVSIWLF